jgi:hypothetical protein
MKKAGSVFCRICFSCLLIFLFAGCMKDRIRKTYQISTPIYETLTKYREGIKSQPASALVSPGKLSVNGKYIFLSEPGLGIHVIDNSNPSAPRNVSFINIPGNEDMAIKENTMYADSYGDLVTFDITDPQHVVAKNFAGGIFADHSNYYLNGAVPGPAMNPDSVQVVAGWSTRDTTVDFDPNNNNPVPYYNYCPTCFNVSSVPAAAGASQPGVATNGSTARFSIIGNFLYTVDTWSLTSFNISEAYVPVFASTVSVDFHVETIYPLKDKLFVGTNNGMYMYDVQHTPSNPALLGEFTHVRGCDPVVADDNYAYITLNDSSACLGFYNELQIVNIKDLANSFMISSYQLIHPMGLAKDGDNLFICDGKDGLKVFNTADPGNLKLTVQLKGPEVYDVVAANGLAIVVAKKGLYQYDYTDVGNIHLISKL